jgi:anion-transporting  ArsA/GET3 family ATPase
VTTRLHVMLGAGGVGKTTLAAAYAAALARRGARVGLLGIDPARRLQTALGLPLDDQERLVPGTCDLHAALLGPEESLRRWANEACPDAEALGRLSRNPFYVALASRLAASTDVLAAVRIAEWAERDPDLCELVVDTAPGLNAIEFLRHPESVTAFLEGRLVAWLRLLAGSRKAGFFAAALRGTARRTLLGLSRIAGKRVLLDLADLMTDVEGMLETMTARLERATRWIHDASTSLLLVTAVREDAVVAVEELTRALENLSLAPHAIIVNRALPAGLDEELARLDLTELAPPALHLVRYAHAHAEIQARVTTAVARFAPRIAVVPFIRALAEAGRIQALADLGEPVVASLATMVETRTRPRS